MAVRGGSENSVPFGPSFSTLSLSVEFRRHEMSGLQTSFGSYTSGLFPVVSYTGEIEYIQQSVSRNTKDFP